MCVSPIVAVDAPGSPALDVYTPLPGGNHRAVGDALAALALMQRMAAYATGMLEPEQEAETEDDLAELLPEEERGVTINARDDSPGRSPRYHREKEAR